MASDKAAPRHGGGAAAARRHHQWWQRRRWGRMTKAAAVVVCGGEKKLLLRFLNFNGWRGGRLSGRPFCSCRIPRVRFLSEQSHLGRQFLDLTRAPLTKLQYLFSLSKFNFKYLMFYIPNCRALWDPSKNAIKSLKCTVPVRIDRGTVDF